jgi:tRNA pseudouridine32 synthase/23S rRNA pseudouridine746 synthase
VAVHGGPWADVTAFLAARLPQVVDWPQRLARGDVLDTAGQPLSPAAPARPGAVLWYWRALPAEPRVPFELALLHQDEQLVVVDKPHFLPVLPRGRHLQETALVRTRRLLGLPHLTPMHRLDLETAGVLVFTVQAASRDAYQGLLRRQQVHKVYEAVAPWCEALAAPCLLSHRLQEREGDAFMQMAVLPGEPNAHTRVTLLRRLPGRAPDGRPLALYRLQPLTGRKHQLRAQMCAAGAPLLGDRIYPRLRPAPAPDAAPDWDDPLQLLARELSFTDPLTGQPRRFVSRRRLDAVPDDDADGPEGSTHDPVADAAASATPAP